MENIFKQWVDLPQSSLRGLSEIGITTHWIILQYSIGLFTMAILMEILAYKFEDKDFMKISRTLSKVAIVIFAVGSATGSMSEFGLLLFWPNLLELVGKYFFIPLYLEVFAFFAEVIFVYMYYYTWERVSRRFHVIIGLLALGGVLASSMLIMSVNTLLSYPPGILQNYDPNTGNWIEPTFLFYLPEGGSQEFTSTQLRNLINSDTDRYQAILGATVSHEGVFGIVFQSPGSFVSGLHAIFSGITVTVYTMLGIYAYRYLKFKDEKNQKYYDKGIKTMTIIGLIVLVIQGIIGHFVALNVAKYNPAKLSAMEGHSREVTTIGDLPIIGSFLNFLAYGNPNAKILEYEDIPVSFQPPFILHYIYYSKLILAMLLFVDTMILVYYIYKKIDFPIKLLKVNVAAPVVVQLISNLGWITRELGRKPWTIYGVMTVDEAARDGKIPLILFIGVVLYTLFLLFGLGALIWYLFHMNPTDLVEDGQLKEEVKELEVKSGKIPLEKEV